MIMWTYGKQRMHYLHFRAFKAMRWKGVISAFFLVAPLFLNIPARSQGASPRDLIQSGVDAYIKTGPSAAFSAWSKGGFAEDNSQLRLKFDALKQIDAAYGKMEGFDVILDLNAGTRVRFIYFVLYYGKGTAYGYIEAFRLKSGGWVMADIDINTKPQEVIPASLLPRIPASQ
jgi:hypothetical protein